MKKLLLSLTMIAAFGSAEAQNLLTENFDVFPISWTQTNQSTPVGLSTWAQGGGTAFASGAFNGGATSFGLVNFNSTTGAGTISNWLITPTINVQNGDVISFYTRQGGEEPSFADRLEMRVSTAGDFSTLPTGGSAGLGDFTLLAASVNPDLTQDGYPLAWTQISYTVSGLTGETAIRVGFRYFVTDGGPAGNNSNIIGIDAFSVDRSLSTQNFFAANYAVSPNPADNVLNLVSKTNVSLNNAELTDINGRVVKTLSLGNVAQAQINIADLTTGVYFLKVSSNAGVGTTKIVKK